MHLSCKSRKINGELALTRSKSESNRALIIQALGEDIQILNLAEADDTQLLIKALNTYRRESVIDVHHAGTAFRFLTAFLATRPSGEWTLTGSQRMKERPIKVLVDALKSVGAKVEYLEEEGYPPLKILGNAALSSIVEIDGGVSSQYISALLLVAPTLSIGLQINLHGKITSLPYLEMTLQLMQHFGVQHQWVGNSIHVANQPYQSKTINIEADWSAASYWYGFVALAEVGSSIHLKGLNEESLQGDAILKEIYTVFGVQSTFQDGGWLIEKITNDLVSSLTLDLNMAPDIAQTILCTCAGLGMGVTITGLHTLKIKETDRVAAMQNELAKFGVDIEIISDDEVKMRAGQQLNTPTSSVATYQDHRMAMAFAILMMRIELKIENPEVVSKSYPGFWEDLKNNIK